MKDRLAKFIKIEGLSPSRFAEILGAQPSSISHLLAGRNKPGFDFLARMIQRFPRVNPDWLLLGTGPMYRPTAGEVMPGASSEAAARPTFPPPTLSPQPAENRVDPSPRPAASEYAAPEAAYPEAFDEPQTSDAFSWGAGIRAETPPAPAAKMPKPQSAATGSVSRIILCHDDGTFEVLVPGPERTL